MMLSSWQWFEAIVSTRRPVGHRHWTDLLIIIIIIIITSVTAILSSFYAVYFGYVHAFIVLLLYAIAQCVW
jgi:hypothetical protein